MDYAKFAILLTIVLTIIIAVEAKKSVFKLFGIPQNKPLRMEWRAYLICCMLLGAFIAMGITFVVKSIAEAVVH
ncbi:hypothetical protein [Puia sp.]|jgi:energy-converting hydrogenase Eha subunit A|uniref:hypothetical protein n=1 Tax=Puia sp. TaxID=2045100 RepID=UPI002F412F31